METRRAALPPHALPARIRATLAAIFVLAFASLAPSAVRAQPSVPWAQQQRIDELKRLYLACDREATSGRLSSAQIMQCSVIYEELKQHAFGGDFGALLAWSRRQPPVQPLRR